MNTALITGSNRGLGLEFTKQLAAAGWQIHACCRNPDNASELQALSQDNPITLHQVDVNNTANIAKLQADLNAAPIDLLINNAGVMGNKDSNLNDLDTDDILSVFKVNALAPLSLLAACKDNLAASDLKLVGNITSRMGSIRDNTSGGYYAYRTSKAALNMLMRSAQHECLDAGIKILLLHPGWVQTDMGGSNALIDSTTSVSGLLNVLFDENSEAGHFYNYLGEEIPW